MTLYIFSGAPSPYPKDDKYIRAEIWYSFFKAQKKYSDFTTFFFVQGHTFPHVLKGVFISTSLKSSWLYLKMGSGKCFQIISWNTLKMINEGFSFLNKAVPIRKIDPEDLIWLVGHTKRDETEIKEMHRRFATEYPSGSMLRQ